MRPTSGGFTLIEMLITVSLIAVLLALAGPSMRDLLLNNRQAADYNTMLSSLALARAEAIKRGADTRVCITNGAAKPDCDNAATRWENGWIAFVDGNQVGASDGAMDDPWDANGNNAWDPGEDWLLQVNAGLASGTTLRGNNNVVRGATFNRRGFSGSTGTLRLCDSRDAEEARGIIISNTGRARQALDSNDDGTVEDGGGNNLTCP